MFRNKYKTLSFDVVMTSEWLQGRRRLSDRLDDLVAWNEVPEFPKIGRCAYLKEKVRFNGQEENMLIKLKGVGYKSHLNKIAQAENRAVYNRNPHLGIDNRGSFFHVCSEPAPVGGLCLNRAVKEYQVAQQLISVDCPAAIPLRVYKYIDPTMFFDNPKTNSVSHLGVAVTCMPARYAYRGDVLYTHSNNSSFENEMLKEWMRALKIDDKNEAMCYYYLLQKINAYTGKTLRRFSEAGLYRYSSAPDNFTYIPKFDEVYIMDFDSCMELKRLNEIEKPMQIMRDVASGLSYLITYLTNPKNIEFWNLKDVLYVDPFVAYLKGYFPEVNSRYIEQVAAPIYEYYQAIYRLTLLKYMEEKKKVHPVNFCKYLENGFNRIWISRSESFAKIMPVIYLLYKKSMFLDKYSKLLHFNHFMRNISLYSSRNVGNQVYESFKKYGLLFEVEK